MVPAANPTRLPTEFPQRILAQITRQKVLIATVHVRPEARPQLPRQRIIAAMLTYGVPLVAPRGPVAQMDRAAVS
jgi:hypothetical protein